MNRLRFVAWSPDARRAPLHHRDGRHVEGFVAPSTRSFLPAHASARGLAPTARLLAFQAGFATAMALSLATPTDAHASVVTVGPHDIRSLFYIGKSDDRNQVHYGVRLDSNCVPIGNEPVFPYWKQIEKGTDVYESLSLLDRTVYSVRKQTVVRSPNASWITFELKATSKRSLTAYVQKVNGQCVAETHTIISGKTARLQRIFVQLGGLFSVRYIDIFGSELGSNQPLVERTKP